uniref:Uncharacterized protein n=1 Tax=Arundo donax TaxID=35708 RepID=A0A0A9CNG6_ARUDO
MKRWLSSWRRWLRQLILRSSQWRSVTFYQLLTRMSSEPDVPHGASYPPLSRRKRGVATRTVPLSSRTTVAR